MEDREEKLERYRRRLSVLLTKGGELNEAEKAFIEHLENQLTTPEAGPR